MIADNIKEKKFRCIKLKNSLESTIVNINITVDYLDISNIENLTYSKKENFSLAVWKADKELIIPVLPLEKNEAKEHYIINLKVEYKTLAEEKFIYKSSTKKTKFNRTKLKRVRGTFLYKFSILPFRIYYQQSYINLNEPLTYTRIRLLKNKHDSLDNSEK